MTSQDVDEKTREHNEGTTSWTRSHRPLKLVYFEEFEDKALARKREKFFKTGDGKRALNNLLAFATNASAEAQDRIS